MSRRALGLAMAALLFVVLATANSGGYRFGVSDQSYYAAAVIKALHPDRFPRDGHLLDVQSHLMWADEIVASLVRVTGLGQPAIYLAIYLATLGLLGIGAALFGRVAMMSPAAIAALLLLLTFRHRIARTGANSLEGYMHPRMLAFALGAIALAAVLKRRSIWAIALILLAACWHPTTALWFGIVVGVGIAGPYAAERPRLTAVALAAAIGAAAAIVFLGPLSSRLVVMDPEWLRALAAKDYLFPHEWPFYAWALNLGYPAVIVAVHRRRRALGVTAPGEPYVVAGALALTAIFLVSVPLTALRIALAVQMQVTRVFWVMDFMAIAYLAWWLIDDWLAARRTGQLAVIAVLVVASLGRGVFLLSRNRPLFTVGFPDTPWIQANGWLRAQPADWYVLADPTHTWTDTFSVRLAAEKDTLLEIGKDSALAIYDRPAAMQVLEREAAVGSYDDLGTAQVAALAERYGLDVAIRDADRPLDFPVLYRNRHFVIYKLP